ncbi:DUF5056 domain-containing protein [Odoribacter sp. OttesenSCG-928-L07]|nr:DUF5056 domain-containing protein [Odoribacter sp. OttesenSCG-928-L07]MDL2239173.1 DUF5056 domain-containing protein [Bacteroidales bacterium OttesenSCG-928-L14]
MNNDDQLIYNFLQENKIEIEDNGFSKKVVKSIDRQKSRRFAKVWNLCCVAVGILILVFLVYSFNSQLSDLFQLVKNSIIHSFSTLELPENKYPININVLLPIFYIYIGVCWLFSTVVLVKNIRK